MKRKTFSIFISSLVLFLLLSCGISVPFMWDSSKVKVTRNSESNTIEVKDPNYTLANGYHISVMYVYALTDGDVSNSRDWWTSFEKTTRRDSHNSKNYGEKQLGTNINLLEGDKDKKQYPVFMMSAENAGSSTNFSPDYLFNQKNAVFAPNRPVTFKYSWDKDGFLDIEASGEGFETFSYKMARTNGKSFSRNDFSLNDPEFEGEDYPVKFEDGKNYRIHIMPVVYARSDHHPNVKLYMYLDGYVVMDTSDIRFGETVPPATGR